jgi:hypothetical protein
VRSLADSSADGRNLTRVVAAASIGVLVAWFWPVALRRVFVYADLGNGFLPLRLFLAENLARDITPLWMPNLFCGFYAHGEGQIGIFHPLRWLAYRFLPVSEAFNLECLLPYPLALCGVALFLRRLALPASAAIFGGATFAFSAYLTLRLTHLPAIAVIAHLGWLLAALDALLRESGRARRRAWIGVALLTGSQALVGYPPAIAYCWMIAIPYALWVAASRRELAPLGAAAGALGVGVLLGAIQLLPTYDHLLASQRAGISFEEVTEFSLHPLNLLTVVGPWLFRHHAYQERFYDPIERVLYFGSVAPIAVVWVALRWRSLGPWRPLVVGLAALSALALVFALGAHTPLYRHLLELPLVGWLRAPARYSLVLYFAAAVCSALALADLARGAPRAELQRASAWIWAVPALAWLVAVGALALRDPGAGVLRGLDIPLRQLSAPPWVVLGPLLATTAAAGFWAAARGQRAAHFALAVFALAELAAYPISQWWVDPPRTLADYRAGIAPPPAEPPARVATPRSFGTFPTRDGRVHWWSSTTLVVRDARLVSGYIGLAPAKRLDYEQPNALRAAGASVQLVGQRFTLSPGALPRARLVTSARVSADPAADLEALDVESSALVDEPVALEAGPPGRAQIERDLPGAISLSVAAATRQLLVLSESFHPGWRLLVDGAPARALRANGDFLGVAVDPGAHRVELRFAPRSFIVGRWTSLAALAFVLGVALVGVIPRAPVRLPSYHSR